MTVLLSDLKLVLPDLLGKKRALLEGTNTGRTYHPLLEARLQEIDDLPAGPQAGTPLAAELAGRDDEHDGFGGAIWHLTEAYDRCPDTPEQVRAAAARIRAQFIPSLNELQARFTTEAQRARDRKALLGDFKDDLDLFPIAGNKTLHDWASSYIDAGLALNDLLSDRADTPLDSRAGAGALRTRTLGVLTRMRGALADEIAMDDKLPRDLEAQVFAYFDQLAAQRASRRRGKQAAPPATDPGAGQPPKG